MDEVPLRSGQTGGRGEKNLIVYSDDNFVGCAGWLCCASGVAVLAAFFIVSALPGLEEQWQWLEEECYIISHNRSCLDDAKDRASCKVSIQVALSSAPVCDGAKCEKRQRTIYYSSGLDRNDDEMWLLSYDKRSILPCYDNSVINATSFDAPQNNLTSQMTIPFAISLIFFVVAFFFVATYLKPTSIFGRAVRSMGIQKKALADEEQGQSMKNLSASHSRSDLGNDEVEDEEQESGRRRNTRTKSDMTRSYQDLQTAGVVMDFEPSEEQSTKLEREEQNAVNVSSSPNGSTRREAGAVGERTAVGGQAAGGGPAPESNRESQRGTAYVETATSVSLPLQQASAPHHGEAN